MTQDNALAPEEDVTIQLSREEVHTLAKHNIELQAQNIYLHEKLRALEALLAQIHDEEYAAVDEAGESIAPSFKKPRGFFVKLLDLPMELFYYFRGR
jgi:hypothetical protein